MAANHVQRRSSNFTNGPSATNAAGDHEPIAWLRRTRRRAQANKRFLDRRHAKPVHLGALAQRRTDCMNVRIDQPRNHRAPAKIDYACLLACETFDRG